MPILISKTIELKGQNYYSKVFKRINYRLSNNTFWVVIIALDHLLLIEPKTKVGVGPNPYPQTQPCLSWPMTWVYISSIDIDAPNDAEVEEDVPSGWDSNCWNWSWNCKKTKKKNC